jgi:hypothetical protein
MDNSGRPTGTRIALDAAGHAAADMARTGRDAGALILDGLAVVAKGLRILDGDGAHDDPAPGDHAPSRLWHPDPQRRSERADLLRALAATIEADAPPTADDLVECVPATWIRLAIERSAESILLDRLNLGEAASGMSRNELTRAMKRAMGEGRVASAATLRTLAAVARTQTNLRSDAGCSGVDGSSPVCK